MFERFTDEARRVPVYAQEEARLLGHPYIGTEHLLLGLLHDEDDPTGQAMRAAGLDRAAVRMQLTRLVGPAPAAKPSGHIPFTDRTKQVLVNALRVTERFGKSHIGRPHLLCGLLEVRDGMAHRLLTELGVDVDELARTAEDLAARDVAPSGEHRVTTRTAHAQLRPAAPIGRPLARRRAKASDRERLLAALRRYGRHEEGCNPEQGCTCGLDDELNA